MPQSNVNIRMDEDLKRNFDRICNDLGINMSTAITILAKKMIREQRIPFEVAIDPFYTRSNENVLVESKAQLESGRVVQKSIEELEVFADE